ncbi:MAG: hypothetical protein ITD33_06500 [Nitrosarchaeum sp.]|nr:hypothetical protein [Nitrosarchaeum sp.]
MIIEFIFIISCKSNGKLGVNFDWIKAELRKPFAEEFEKEFGFPIGQSGYPELTRDQWSKNTEKIIKVIQKFLELQSD